MTDQPAASAGGLPTAGEDPSGYWLLAGAIVAVPLVLVAILSFVLHWHWLPALWFNYSWPSDKGNGPEALQQTIAYAIIAAVFIPAVRHFIAREFDKVHKKIDHVHATMEQNHQQRKTADDELHAHLHHLGRHMGAPIFDREDHP
jgi:hypothetical protein